MKTPRLDSDHGAVVVQSLLVEKRRRLGSALQQLASDLARERRRSAELERELERLRREASGVVDRAGTPRA